MDFNINRNGTTPTGGSTYHDNPGYRDNVNDTNGVVGTAQSSDVHDMHDVNVNDLELQCGDASPPPPEPHSTVVHDQLPSVEDVKLNLNSNMFGSSPRKTFGRFSNWRNRRMVRVFMYGVIVLSAAIIFTGILKLTIAGEQKGRPSGNSMAGKGANGQSRVQQMMEIVSNRFSDPDAFEVVNSPQRLAIQWLANDDQLAIDIPPNKFFAHMETDADNDGIEDSVEMSIFLQRYAMAVISIALTGGADSIRRGEPNPLIQHLNFFNGEHECRWHTKFQRPDGSTLRMGIACNADNQVEKIILQGLGLGGSLPNEVGLLSNLQVLRLDSNNITSLIPQGIRHLSSLEHLSLSQNNFHGMLNDKVIGQMSNLESLELSYNNFGGELPATFSQLKSLEYLALDHNRFKGDLSTLGFLTELEEIYLTDNRFEDHLGELFLNDLPKLRVLDLSSNKLKGHFPSNLLSKPLVRVINLHDNALSGSLSTVPIPDIDGSKLQYLDLKDNFLTGVIPDSISNLERLTHLDLSSNRFNGVLPASMKNLLALKYFYVDDNKGLDSAEVPHWVKYLTNLEELSMKDTSRKGHLPNALGNLPNLKLLNLGWNNITGPILPSLISNSTQLEFLILNRNGLTGEVPAEIKLLKDLKLLLLDHNELHGTVDDGICKLNDLEVIITDCGDVEDEVTEDGKAKLAETEVRCDCCTRCCAKNENGCNSGDGYMMDMYDQEWGDEFQRSGVNVFPEQIQFQPL